MRDYVTLTRKGSPPPEAANVAYAQVALVEPLAGRRAADALRAPFVLGDLKELAHLVASAGVVEATITTQPGAARFPSIRFMIEADLRGWLPLMGVVLTEDQIDRILQEAERVLGAYVTAVGTTTLLSWSSPLILLVLGSLPASRGRQATLRV